MESGDLWKDTTLLIPSIAAVASGILLTVMHTSFSCSLDIPQQDAIGEVLVAVNEWTRGPVIFGLKIARLIGCFNLIFSDASFTVLCSVGSVPLGAYVGLDLPQIAMSATFWYTSFLAAISIVQNTWSQSVTRHINFVLFITLVVYVYRDVSSLATYTENPVDGSEGAPLWTKLVVFIHNRCGYTTCCPSSIYPG